VLIIGAEIAPSVPGITSAAIELGFGLSFSRGAH
jgi:hypothetical protein